MILDIFLKDIHRQPEFDGTRLLFVLQKGGVVIATLTCSSVMFPHENYIAWTELDATEYRIVVRKDGKGESELIITHWDAPESNKARHPSLRLIRVFSKLFRILKPFMVPRNSAALPAPGWNAYTT
jgi:hypothetical protein